jgi:hypothetical protein
VALKAKSETARISAARELLDRKYGRSQQSMEISIPAGDPIPKLLDDIDEQERERERSRHSRYSVERDGITQLRLGESPVRFCWKWVRGALSIQKRIGGLL